MAAEVQRMFFSPDQASSLTTLSLGRLSYWRKSGFFGAVPEKQEMPLYSFRDIVGLRTLASLRQRVSLQQLRRVGQWLSINHDAPWSSLRFFLAGKTVVFTDPVTGSIVSTKPRDQLELGEPIELEKIAAEVDADAAGTRDRKPEQFGTVVSNRRVMGNAAALAGTRIPTTAIWNLREAGYSTERILREYPTLTPADVRAALEYEGHQPRRRRRSA